MSSSSPRKRLPRGRLTRDTVVSAALTLADRVGVEGLTMKGVADELKCGTMTLYTHVADREDLLRALVGRMLDEMDTSHREGESWQDSARRIFASYHAVAARHRRAFELIVLAPNEEPPVCGYLHKVVRLFIDGGLAEGEALDFVSLADAFASGFLLMQSSAMVRQEYLPHDRGYGTQDDPRLLSLLTDAAYKRGCEAILTGFTAALAGSQSRSSGASV